MDKSGNISHYSVRTRISEKKNRIFVILNGERKIEVTHLDWRIDSLEDSEVVDVLNLELEIPIEIL